MKDKTKILKPILVVTLFASVILACYIRLTAKTSTSEDATVDNSEVGQILAKDMDLNYPSNPHDVVTYYSRIIKAFYDGKYTDDQLTAWHSMRGRCLMASFSHIMIMMNIWNV